MSTRPVIATNTVGRLRTEFADTELRRVLASDGIDLERLHAYLGVQTETAFRGREVDPDIDSLVRVPSPQRRLVGDALKRRLDLERFGSAVHAALSVVPISGYALRVFERDRPVYTLVWNWARRPQDAPERGWSPDVKMHVASVSKLITSIALLRLLHERGIPVDAPIVDYMPEYFSRGPHVERLSFRHLLTHTSGFRMPDSAGLPDHSFAHFRFSFEVGVDAADIGVPHYHNTNFIGLRIAMAVVLGRPARAFRVFDRPILGQPPRVNLPMTDAAWDSESIAAYEAEVASRVLVPAGVSARVTTLGNDSLAYPADLAVSGSTMDANTSAGTVGWWMSCDDLLKVMHLFRDTNRLLPAAKARKALSDGFGVDGLDPWQFTGRGAVDCFTKSGFWSDPMGRTMQSVVAFAPRKHSVAVLVNSPIPGTNVDALVRAALRSSID